jgi:hypothetical protein
MRLRELTGYKKDPIYNILQNSTDSSELEDNLEANGFKKYVIGTGLYSSVLSRPDLNYVVKIFYKDRGYETYLKYMTKYQNNPHVPKMRGKVMSVGSGFKVVRLERLEAYSGTPEQQEIIAAIREYIDMGNASRQLFAENFPFPQMIPVLNDILKHTGLDMHTGNIMFRGSTPVITDPLSDR